MPSQNRLRLFPSRVKIDFKSRDAACVSPRDEPPFRISPTEIGTSLDDPVAERTWLGCLWCVRIKAVHTIDRVTYLKSSPRRELPSRNVAAAEIAFEARIAAAEVVKLGCDADGIPPDEAAALGSSLLRLDAERCPRRFDTAVLVDFE